MEYVLWEVLKANKKKNISFYGISQDNCQLISESEKFMNIFYMDLDMPITASPDVYIDTLEKAAEKQIDAFVIMRQMIANQVTFYKLLEYCKKYKADIYDKKGRNIRAICTDAIERENCSREMIQREITSHECISFDIFDTLLMRKVLVPEDVFELTEYRLQEYGIVISDFKNKRKKAQEILGLTNPNIDEIYTEFEIRYGISEEISKRCRDIEIEIEEEVLIPRKDMVELFKRCILEGKRVCLVSDMYISKSILEKLLEKKGIFGYENLYISCDKKKLKLQGLFEVYQKETGGKRYLHIGDHLIHDGICAGLAGIDYCLIANSYDMALKTDYRSSIREAKSLEEHVMLGLSIARVLNSPFSVVAGTDAIKILSDYDYGYGFCAGIIAKFALWLFSEVKKEHFDDILFASRDGYLVKKMYGILRRRKIEKNNPLPKGKYFYISRKAAVMTCVNNETCFNMLINMSPQLEPEKMMKERFNLQENQILPYDAEKYETIHRYVCAHIDAIFKRTDEARYNYYRYMRNIDLEIGGRYAFMDFVSSGTSQRSISRIAPFEIVGFYIGSNSIEEQKDINVKSLYSNSETYFLKHYKIIETFMTSQEPSLSYFNEEGNPVFQEQDRTIKELSYVKEMQDACLDFFVEFINIIDRNVENISNTFLDNIFSVSNAVVIENEDCVLNHISLMDDWVQVRLKKEEIIIGGK